MSIANIWSPDFNDVWAIGRSLFISTICIPFNSNIEDVTGAIMKIPIKKNTNARTIFENGPADKTDNCLWVDFFANCFSSGSTNAANIGPKKAKPDDFIFTFAREAYTPWKNSWTTAVINIAIIQCQKDNVGTPGIETPGNTGARTGIAFGIKIIFHTPFIKNKKVIIIPINPIVMLR